MFNDDCMDHLSEIGDKQLLLSYLNLKSLIKISLKEEFVHTKSGKHQIIFEINRVTTVTIIIIGHCVSHNLCLATALSFIV